MPKTLTQTLEARGCGAGQAARLAARFEALGYRAGEIALWVPGRIELVGNHVDYAGGSSLTIATARGMCLVARPTDDPVLRIDMPADDRFAELPLETSIRGEGWVNYPATLVRRVLQNFPAPIAGAEVVMDSDLPLAAGLSSSSALMTALFLAWGRVAGWLREPLLQDAAPDALTLAAYISAVENGRPFAGMDAAAGVGTLGGAQDHTAILCSRPGEVGRYRYVPPAREGTYGWPAGVDPLVMTSGVVAEKAHGALEDYNRASGLATALRDVWNSEGRKVAVLGDLDPVELRQLGSRLTGDLARRLESFFEESAVVETASAALKLDDVAAFAEAVNRSQEVAETLTRNQVPETVGLCRALQRAGALAATSFGAGFGGAVWALVPSGQAQSIGERAAAEYRRELDREARVLPERAGPGAFFVDGWTR